MRRQFKGRDATDRAGRGRARAIPRIPRRDGVAPGLDVETFAALRLHFDSWRWAGVPFYIRAGKCLAVTATEVRVDLKPPATCCSAR